MQPAHVPPVAAMSGPTRGFVRGWAMTILFLIFYTVAFIDRQVITMMVGPLQSQLGLTEFQISLLMGPSFGVFFALCGLMVGGIVDRHSRRWIVTLATILWGAATCMCGLAGSYPVMLVGRMGVGVGESALTPSAHSLIIEQFPRARLSTALAVFSLGAVVGGGLAAALGGTIVHLVAESAPVRLPLLGTMQPWQMVFLIIGIPTMLMAPLALLVRENVTRPASSAQGREAVSARTFLRFCRTNPLLFFGLPVGFGLLNIITSAYLGWMPTFMVRSYGWNIAEVGLAWGVQHIAAAALGQVGGAMLVDRLYARGMKDAHVRYQWIGVLIGVPLTILGLLSGNIWLFLALSSVYHILCYPFLGYAVAALQLHTPPELRGRMSAWFIAVITMMGTFIGAPFTAWLTESVFVDKAKLGASLITVSAVVAPLVVIVLMVVGRHLRRMDHRQHGAA
ncbi:MFS transporter [Sphingobium sp. Sx8-8]|uniref:MFS transporter n=1 Tax=Sphingobium sp. Sx8-8 TaxID=2933617 RepID=UPI001F57B969|nr:MFS transporter [Sphingobium sp. Sx8-8]